MSTIVDALADFAVKHRLMWNSDDTNRPSPTNGLEWNDDGFTYRTATPESRDAVADMLVMWLMEHGEQDPPREWNGTIAQAAEIYGLIGADSEWWASEPGIFISGVLQVLERLCD